MKLDRVLVVFGTRPEAIKMAPVIHELHKAGAFETKVCVSAQHRQMLDQVLALFDIKPDFDLNLMKADQHLADLSAGVLCGIRDLFHHWRPDLVLVQGDTTTTFAASLAAFYENIPVGHVEAGLRTGNKHSPWPEEINRSLTGILATFHFAPTEGARRNLLAEGISPCSIAVTGNTVIDALRESINRIEKQSGLLESFARHFTNLDGVRRLVLVTAHRRENFGPALQRICRALRKLAERNNVVIVYPVHLNPNVQAPVREILSGLSNIHLIEPLDYLPFAYLMQRCYLILTDSGGIQEEAPFLGKPVLLMRDTTERPEAVEAGTVRLVGTDEKTILQEATRLLDDQEAYRSMSQATNPFGDGFAARRIVKYLMAAKASRTLSASSSRQSKIEGAQ